MESILSFTASKIMSSPRDQAHQVLAKVFQTLFPKTFETSPKPLTEEEKNAFLASLPKPDELNNDASSKKKTKKSKKSKKKKKTSQFSSPMIIKSNSPKFMKKGHLICPNALETCARLHALNYPDQVTPKWVAEQIKAAIPADNKILDSTKTEVQVNGFFSLFYSRDYLKDFLISILDNGISPPYSLYKDATSQEDDDITSTSTSTEASTTSKTFKKSVLVDFSSPNIAKEMHVGHLRSTIIGESICRIFEFCGYNVHRINHIGDWGTQFGMLISHLKDIQLEQLGEGAIGSTDETIEATDIEKFTKQLSTLKLGKLEEFYVAAKKKFKHEDFKVRSRAEVVRLQGGDPVSLAAWKFICDVSALAYRDIYKRLDISITDVGESFYNPIIPQVIQHLESLPHPTMPGKSLVHVNSGAKVLYIEPPSDGPKTAKGQVDIPPLMVEKSGGGYTYDSTDLAALYYRLKTLKVNRIFYVVGNPQKQHFDMLFKAGEMAGWIQPHHVIKHVGFGSVLDENGKKFSTSSGQSIRLVSLLDSAVAEFRESLIEREKARVAEAEAKGETVESMTPEKINSVSSHIAHAAVKYYDLKSHRERNYSYDKKQILNMTGNTAVYLQYQYARICQIKSKKCQQKYGDSYNDSLLGPRGSGGPLIDILRKTTSVNIDHDSEYHLAAHATLFSEMVEAAAVDCIPHRIAEWLYDHSQHVSHFYRDCRVVGSKHEDARLLLLEIVGRFILKSMDLLGFTPLIRI